MPLNGRPYFGVGVDVSIPHSDQLLARVRAADQSGYDLFSIMDHPYAHDRHEAYSTLAFALGSTERIVGYVGVSNLPLRPAPVLARTVSTLSALSGERVVLGLGSGGMWDRIAEFGVPARTPGEAVGAFEEAIELVKALTGGGADPVTFPGRFYQVSSVLPAPVATPPIWTGATGPRALAITGRLADGWIPGFGADWLSERYQQSRPIIDRAAEKTGRDPSEILTYFNVGGVLTRADSPRTRGANGRWVGGSAKQWTEELTAAVLTHGAAGFNTNITNESGELDLDTLRRFADDVIPAVREAVQ